MPRPTKTHAASGLAPTTLVVDNGAYTIKAGFVSASPDVSQCQTIPNCVARSRDRRVYVGPQLSRCTDFGEMAFRRPVEKGYLVGWEAERAIWEQCFLDKAAPLKCDPHETNLVLTEAPSCPQVLQTACDQIVFEEFEFAGYYRCLGPPLHVFHDSHPAPLQHKRTPSSPLLVIDSGYSHTIVTPVLYGRPAPRAIRRLDVGGKLLTNYLREIVSLRHYDLRDEPHLLSEMKEDVCYVSDDFSADLDRARQKDVSVVVDYVLPDYERLTRGFARPHDPAAAVARAKRLANPAAGGEKEHVVPLGNERFAVPELLFDPRDVGMQEAGLAGVVAQSLDAVPAEGLRAALLANVLLVGGNARIPWFRERLELELRREMPDHIPLRIATADDPVKSTWQGGAKMASDRETLKRVAVTRQEYQEHGSTWLARRFAKAAEY